MEIYTNGTTYTNRNGELNRRFSCLSQLLSIYTHWGLELVQQKFHQSVYWNHVNIYCPKEVGSFSSNTSLAFKFNVKGGKEVRFSATPLVPGI